MFYFFIFFKNVNCHFRSGQIKVFDFAETCAKVLMKVCLCRELVLNSVFGVFKKVLKMSYFYFTELA